MRTYIQISMLLIITLLISCAPKKKTRTKKYRTKQPKTSNEVPLSSGNSQIKENLATANYMTGREKEMIKEINLIRSNPKGYVPIVESYIKKQKAGLKNVVSGKKYILEEIEVAKELIRELKRTASMPVLSPDKGVYRAAKLHGQEGKRKGSLDHTGKNGSWPWDRITKEAGYRNGGENLVGGLSDVRESVLILLIDSGIENRGHRKALLNPKWKYVACYEVGKVGDMPYYWVQNFAF